MRRLQPVRGGRGGLRSREHIPSEVFHLRQMQVSNDVRPLRHSRSDISDDEGMSLICFFVIVRVDEHSRPARR